MKLTALEIKQQQFEKSLRGYDPAEVNSYLSLLASEWEHLTGKVRELETQVDKMNDKLRHYERVEEALHETLQTAKSSAEEKLSVARKEAAVIREKAELEAESIVQGAHHQRREMRQNIIQLIDRRDEIIRSIRTYLDNAQQSVEQFNSQDPELFALPDIPENQEKKREHEQPESSGDAPGTEKIDDILDEID